MKGIYCIENTLDGKKYYGSSMQIEKRLKQHRDGLRKGHHINLFLQRAYNKHGEENFLFTLVEDMGNPSKEELHVKEQWYIDNNIGGYNIAPAGGGDTLLNHPNREQIIEDRTSKFRNWISSLSTEEKTAKFSKPGSENPNWKEGGRLKFCPCCLTNKIEPTATTCSVCRDRTGEKNPFYNRTHTAETKQALKEYQLTNSWIKGIDPALLPYTTHYEITYPDGTTKNVAGLKSIAEEFNVSVANVHSTVKRMSGGTMPSKSVFKNHLIRKIK